MTSPARPTRHSLLEELSRYAENSRCGEDEALTVARMRHFVAHEPQCCERSHFFGHLTGSAWVVNAEGNSVVLLHHKKLGRWLQPGGHADGDPDIRAVARRELAEETGLDGALTAIDGIFDVDIHAIPARPWIREGTTVPEGAHFHFDVRYAFQASPGAQLVQNPESHALRWVPFADVPMLTSEISVLRMLKKWETLMGTADFQ